jgi:glycosyltransferase involved in cell wall biosynthesis
MKTALVYDWFVDGAGGGEKAFEAIYKLFPSPIYTLLQSPQSIMGTAFEKEIIHHSFIQKLPRSLKKYRTYLPLFPMAIEQLDLSAYDVIISCSHCVAKGVLTHADQIHLNYCYTPMRYAWDLYHQYLKEDAVQGKVKGTLAKMFLHYLRLWDYQASQRVDAYAAISHHIAKRIRKTYGKSATVIYPPVDTDFYTVEDNKEDYYLAASRLVNYKKIDVIVEAFTKMPDKKLVVIGDGPDMNKIKKIATKNIELLGHQSNEDLKKHYQKAKAFLFAPLEDFGIMPVEAQACGTPIIAFGKGASLETVKGGETGLFFDEQTPEAIQNAVLRFEASRVAFDPAIIRRHAERFSPSRFNEEFRLWVMNCLKQTQE